MNLDHLSQTFEANKVPILGAAAVGVVGLALWQKHKTGAAAPAAGTPTTAGAYSAGAQAAGTNGAAYYDSSASDVYGLMQPQLESLGQQVTSLSDKLNSVPVSTPPAASTPIAASLYQPQGTGTYVTMPNGVGAEVESDGSLFGMTMQQYQALQGAGKAATPIPLNTNLNYYSTERNVWQQQQNRAAASSPSS